MNEAVLNRKQDGQVHIGSPKSSVQQAVELAHQQSHRGFLGHLFGVDGHQALPNPAHSKRVSWRSAMKALGISNFLGNFHVTMNKLFLMLLMFFASWLFVVYFIRHYGSMNRQPLVNSMPHPSNLSTDLEIINASRTAIPVRSSPTAGEVYEPQQEAPPVPSPSVTTIDTTPISKTVIEVNPAAPVSSNEQNATTNSSGSAASYNMKVLTQDGLRVKTVVNR